MSELLYDDFAVPNVLDFDEDVDKLIAFLESEEVRRAERPSRDAVQTAARNRENLLRRAAPGLRRREGGWRATNERGVRPDVTRRLVTPEEIVELNRRGLGSLLDPYRTDQGIVIDSGSMGTGWQRNARFDATLRSDTLPIVATDLPARRYVSPDESPIESMLQDNGVSRGFGDEYAVFGIQIGANDPLIHAHPRLILSVETTASLNGVVQTTDALGGMMSLNVGKIYDLLVDNASLGRVTRLRLDQTGRSETVGEDGLARQTWVELFKEAAELDAAPRAELTTSNMRFSFRFDPAPEMRKWMLTHVDWWLKRSHFGGRRDDEQFTYWRAEVSVDGREIDPLRVQVFEQEAVDSNALDPRVSLTILIAEDRRSGQLLPLERDRRIEVRVYAATALVSARVSGDRGKRAGTRWVALDALSFTERNTNAMFREVLPRRRALRSDQLTLRREYVPIEGQRDFGTNARGLGIDYVDWNLVATTPNELVRVERGPVVVSGRDASFFSINSIEVGPMRRSAIFEAVTDGRPRISQ